ncbi:MAG TPA: redoxin domain-containing protein [Pyrinomonadaceae bacterium]|nr:redoxin domain-containing protein [Pyrinomonadaceae bacterium]
MYRQKIFILTFLVLTAGTIATISYAKGWSTSEVFSFISSGHGPSYYSKAIAADTGTPVAPELSQGTWINSEPLTLKALKGRVVVVDFWTFGCYNCRNTLPSIKSWDARYRDQGLTIVGVHSPEFDDEKKIENVRREVAALELRYPVVTDNDYATWNAYRVEAWPTIFVLDKSGRIRWQHVGEGAYAETEQVIQKLLAEDSATEKKSENKQ